MTRVKICGLTREEDVDAVVDAGADALGFIVGFPNSPRNLTVARAASLIARVPLFATAVLVIESQALVENSDSVKRIAPKVIQLHNSSFSPETIRNNFHCQLVMPFAVGREESDETGVVAKAKEAAKGYNALLADTRVEGKDGGTGLTPDWSVCAAIREGIAPRPLILSGGLRPENVQLAISSVAPFCVDVSSGVESAPGVKDHGKVKAFVAKANEAEGKQVTQ